MQRVKDGAFTGVKSELSAFCSNFSCGKKKSFYFSHNLNLVIIGKCLTFILEKKVPINNFLVLLTTSQCSQGQRLVRFQDVGHSDNISFKDKLNFKIRQTTF